MATVSIRKIKMIPLIVSRGIVRHYSNDEALSGTGLLALFVYWGVSVGYYTIFHSLIFVGGTDYRWVLLGVWLGSKEGVDLRMIPSAPVGTITITLILVAVWAPKRRKLREEVKAVLSRKKASPGFRRGSGVESLLPRP